MVFLLKAQTWLSNKAVTDEVNVLSLVKVVTREGNGAIALTWSSNWFSTALRLRFDQANVLSRVKVIAIDGFLFR